MMHFYDVHSIPDIPGLIESALKLKKDKGRSSLGKDKTIALVFLNPSLRTRMSTQEAAHRMGMQVIVFNSSDAWPWEIRENNIMDGNKSEHIKDAARVISSYVDMIGIRCFAGLQDQASDLSDEVIHRFMKYATVPVINLESAALHPLQSLTDMMTMEENHPVKKLNVVLTWAPHPKALPQAVANSFAQWCNHLDHNLTICHPVGYNLDTSFTGKARILHDQTEAFRGADIIYAKSWCTSRHYGQPTHAFKDWTVTAEKMDLTRQAFFMHCLPVRRNVVVADEVIDGNRSLVYQQAENRLYAAQAVIHHLLSQQI